MADSLEMIVGRIDGTTQAIQGDVVEIKKNQQAIHDKYTELRSDVDHLQDSHDEHVKACSPVIVNTNPLPLKLSSLLSMREVSMVVVGAVFGVGAVAVGAVLVAGKIAKLW